MHRDTIVPGERILIVDDVLATGGTAEAAATLSDGLGVRSQGSRRSWSSRFSRAATGCPSTKSSVSSRTKSRRDGRCAELWLAARPKMSCGHNPATQPGDPRGDARSRPAGSEGRTPEGPAPAPREARSLLSTGL